MNILKLSSIVAVLSLSACATHQTDEVTTPDQELRAYFEEVEARDKAIENGEIEVVTPNDALETIFN